MDNNNSENLGVSQSPGTNFPPQPKAKFNILLWGAVGLILLAGMFFLGFQYSQNSRESENIPSLETNKVSENDNWKVYTNADYNFQLTFSDAWKGYKVTRSQRINNSGSDYAFEVPTSSGYYKAFVIIALDKRADLPWSQNEPRPASIGSSQTMNFFASFSQDMPEELVGKINANEVVKTFKLSGNTPELSKETALLVLKDSLFDGGCSSTRVEGKYVSCVVNIVKADNAYSVTVTYSGLYDDSVVASRVEATLVYQNGQWVKKDVKNTQKCAVGRGHQDFSAELCI